MISDLLPASMPVTCLGIALVREERQGSRLLEIKSLPVSFQRTALVGMKASADESLDCLTVCVCVCVCLCVCLCVCVCH